MNDTWGGLDPATFHTMTDNQRAMRRALQAERVSEYQIEHERTFHAREHAAEAFTPSDRRCRQTRERREQRIQDIEWLIGTETPDRIAKRVGYASADNMIHALLQWKRRDLVRRLAGRGAA